MHLLFKEYLKQEIPILKNAYWPEAYALGEYYLHSYNMANKTLLAT